MVPTLSGAFRLPPLVVSGVYQPHGFFVTPLPRKYLIYLFLVKEPESLSFGNHSLITITYRYYYTY